MDRLRRLTPELRSQFVAYLDGELDDQQTQEVETVLAQSEVARNDMEALARSYELLELLPRQESSAEFTERTLATVRLEGKRVDPTQTTAYRMARRGLIGAGWCAAVAGAAALGYAITNRWMPGPVDALIDDLPVIEHLDVYAEVGSFEFLQRLTGQTDLVEEMRAQQIDER